MTGVGLFQSRLSGQVHLTLNYSWHMFGHSVDDPEVKRIKGHWLRGQKGCDRWPLHFQHSSNHLSRNIDPSTKTLGLQLNPWILMGSKTITDWKSTQAQESLYRTISVTCGKGLNVYCTCNLPEALGFALIVLLCEVHTCYRMFETIVERELFVLTTQMIKGVPE
jgi:hypothetical protein